MTLISRPFFLQLYVNLYVHSCNCVFYITTIVIQWSRDILFYKFDRIFTKIALEHKLGLCVIYHAQASRMWLRSVDHNSPCWWSLPSGTLTLNGTNKRKQISRGPRDEPRRGKRSSRFIPWHYIETYRTLSWKPHVVASLPLLSTLFDNSSAQCSPNYGCSSQNTFSTDSPSPLPPSLSRTYSVTLPVSIPFLLGARSPFW